MTSVSLEDAFWNSLKEIAAERGMTLQQLVAAIDGNREHANGFDSSSARGIPSICQDQRIARNVKLSQLPGPTI